VEGDNDDDDMSDTRKPSNDSQELALQSPSSVPSRTNFGLMPSQASQPDSTHKALDIPYFFEEMKFPDKGEDKVTDKNKVTKKVCKLCM
jgi:hypothetical protein